MKIISLIIFLLGLYLVLGLIFCVALFFWGLPKIDRGTNDSGVGFKLLIMPGVMALWPVLLVKWIRGSS